MLGGQINEINAKIKSVKFRVELGNIKRYLNLFIHLIFKAFQTLRNMSFFKFCLHTIFFLFIITEITLYFKDMQREVAEALKEGED